MNKSIVCYNSIREFFNSLSVESPPKAYDTSARAFNGNQSYSEARANLFKGDAEAIKRSDAILEKLESDGIELRQESWDTDIIGYFPCVPAAVNGDPDCMFIPVDEQSTSVPMRVFASVCLSGGYSYKQLENRGVAILALVRKLALIRPVELWVYSDQEGKQPCIRLETNPLDLTLASYVMANAGFVRQLCFGWGYHDDRGFDGGWARWGGYAEISQAREALGALDDDLVIPGSYLTRDDMENPVAWVNAHISKYAQALVS